MILNQSGNTFPVTPESPFSRFKSVGYCRLPSTKNEVRVFNRNRYRPLYTRIVRAYKYCTTIYDGESTIESSRDIDEKAGTKIWSPNRNWTHNPHYIPLQDGLVGVMIGKGVADVTKNQTQLVASLHSILGGKQEHVVCCDSVKSINPTTTEVLLVLKLSPLLKVKYTCCIGVSRTSPRPRITSGLGPFILNKPTLYNIGRDGSLMRFQKANNAISHAHDEIKVYPFPGSDV